MFDRCFVICAPCSIKGLAIKLKKAFPVPSTEGWQRHERRIDSIQSSVFRVFIFSSMCPFIVLAESIDNNTSRVRIVLHFKYWIGLIVICAPLTPLLGLALFNGQDWTQYAFSTYFEACIPLAVSIMCFGRHIVSQRRLVETTIRQSTADRESDI
jgi:hypothetical protein